MASKLKIHLKSGGCSLRSNTGNNETDNVNIVNCAICRNLLEGKVQGGRKKGSNGRHSITVTLTNKAFTNWGKINDGGGSKIISDFLESLNCDRKL